MNAIELLKKDHRKVDALFENFEQTPASETKKRYELVQKIVAELRTHTIIEEDVFYPEVKAESGKDVEGDVRESVEEHLQIERLVDDLSVMSPDHEQYSAKVHVLKETVQHHVKEEEEEMFPHVRETLNKKQLEDIGQTLSADRESAADESDRRAQRDHQRSHISL